MLAAPHVLSLLLILLSHSGWTNGLCNLENGTMARCHDLEDVKYIETYDLESLKAARADSVLRPGLFSNLSSLRHLDLSGGDLEKIEPGSFRKLSNLRSLDLADNRIDYLELASLDGLNHLHSLNLRKNNLRQLPPALARLKILRHLDVTGNPLQCNCASLRVRDLIVKRGVKMSKKTICVGPNNMKGTPLMKPDAGIICAFEEQDREMQKDQGYEGSGEEGSTEILDQFDDDNDYGEDEYVEVQTSTEASKEPEVETPYPETEKASTVSSTETQSKKDETTSASEGPPSATSPTDSVEETTADAEEEQIFFDDKNERTSTGSSAAEKKAAYKDALFYPVEGSGDEEEGSGEGSGTGMIFTDGKTDEETNEKTDDDPSNTSGESIFDILFSVLWSTTAAPEEKKEPDLVGEHFIDVSSTKEAVEEVMVTKKVNLDESALSTTTIKIDLFSPVNGVELVDLNGVNETSKLGKVRADESNGDLAEVSPARQSKKGMGSYVVLACLLAILATLIGFAAYKGDFCRKRRKRDDVEHGTEMKDMQKALLDAGNANQPKIASNGNAENAPLVEGANDHEDPRNRPTSMDTNKSPNGTSDYVDPVKPPRRTATPPEEQKTDDRSHEESSSPKEDSHSARMSPVDPMATGLPSNNGPAARPPEPNGPPLSPAAQRVKITLQENPDSVPRTPILITRTMAGENLVKAP